MNKFESKSLPLEQLWLDKENPRFITPPTAAEQDIINYLLEYEEIEELARSINENRGLYAGERIIVTKEDTHYVVLEGNRRVSACKILKNVQLLKNYRPASTLIIYPQTLENISFIDVDILPSRLEAQSSLAAKHIDGIKKWSPMSKKKFFAKEYLSGKSLFEIQRITGSSYSTIQKGIREYNLIQYALNLPEWVDKESGLIVDINKLKVSPFTRVFTAGTSFPNISSLGTLLDLQYDDNMQPMSSIPKEIFDHCIYLVAKSSFDKSIKFDTRHTMQDIVGLLDYLKQQDIFSNYFVSKTSTITDNNSSLPSTKIPQSTDTPSGDSVVMQAASTQTATHETSTISEYNKPATSLEKKATYDTVPQKSQKQQGTGSKKNLPYFFNGLKFGHLDPENQLTHGRCHVCCVFSDISGSFFPVSAALLIRAIIEHSLIYYSKTHKIQASSKMIWERIADKNGNPPVLSTIIRNYEKGLANYIPDSNIRQYFSNLLGTDRTTEQLNWIVHRPEEFIISHEELSALPGKGLLALINYLIQ